MQMSSWCKYCNSVNYHSDTDAVKCWNCGFILFLADIEIQENQFGFKVVDGQQCQELEE